MHFSGGLIQYYWKTKKLFSNWCRSLFCRETFGKATKNGSEALDTIEGWRLAQTFMRRALSICSLYLQTSDRAAWISPLKAEAHQNWRDNRSEGSAHFAESSEADKESRLFRHQKANRHRLARLQINYADWWPAGSNERAFSGPFRIFIEFQPAFECLRINLGDCAQSLPKHFKRRTQASPIMNRKLPFFIQFESTVIFVRVFTYFLGSSRSFAYFWHASPAYRTPQTSPIFTPKS